MRHRRHLIDQVVATCLVDQRLDAALMYGSFAAGLGDRYSDVEFWLFFDDDWHELVQPRAWLSQVAPLTHLVRNEFGTDVAFFDGLIRGEFHFATATQIETVRTWPARGAPVDRMVVLDRRGALRQALEAIGEHPELPEGPAEVGQLCGRFANWVVLAHQVTCRGELLRAWDALGHVQRHLLWLVRLREHSTGHWLTPSRLAEAELPEPVLAQLRQATALAGAGELRTALTAAWWLGRSCWLELAERTGAQVPHQLLADIDRQLPISAA